MSNLEDNGNTVLLRILSAGPAEVWEWGINAEKQPYEEYKWCEDDFYEDSSYIKEISLEELLKVLKIQPLGKGLLDMICSPNDVGVFIDFCNALGKSIKGFTWWCHVTEEHQPCGMGGPSICTNLISDSFVMVVPFSFFQLGVWRTFHQVQPVDQ